MLGSLEKFPQLVRVGPDCEATFPSFESSCFDSCPDPRIDINHWWYTHPGCSLQRPKIHQHPEARHVKTSNLDLETGERSLRSSRIENYVLASDLTSRVQKWVPSQGTLGPRRRNSRKAAQVAKPIRTEATTTVIATAWPGEHPAHFLRKEQIKLLLRIVNAFLSPGQMEILKVSWIDSAMRIHRIHGHTFTIVYNHKVIKAPNLYF